MVSIFGGDEQTARGLYSRAIGTILQNNNQESKKSGLSKDIFGKSNSTIKKVSEEDSFKVMTKMDNHSNQTGGEEFINLREENISIERPKYKIEGLGSWTNRKNRTEKIIRFWFSAHYKIYSNETMGSLHNIVQEIGHTISNKLTSSNIMRTKIVTSTNITHSIVAFIDYINKNINIVHNSYCQYEIKIAVNVEGAYYRIIYVKLKDSKIHKKRALELKIKKEKKVLEAKKKEREKQAKIDSKLEKIYDAKLEKVLNRKLEEEAKRFLEYIKNTYRRIEYSYGNYRNAYDSLGTVGHISAAFAGNFRKPKIDKYWDKALKLCKKVEVKESSNSNFEKNKISDKIKR